LIFLLESFSFAPEKLHLPLRRTDLAVLIAACVDGGGALPLVGAFVFSGEEMSKRARNRKCSVFASGGGFVVVEWLPREECEQRVEMDLLRPEYDQVTGQQRGYRQVGLEAAVDQDMRPRRTQPAISMREMEINAGLYGRSRTAGLSSAARAARERVGRDSEDLFERTRAKVKAWSIPTWIDHAVVVRP
jgi:hypothetical protein